MIRTQEEILKRIEERKLVDKLFAFEWPYYLDLLSYENARTYLKDEVVESEWKTKTIEEVRKEAIDYLPFAWGKANDMRGISASRSLSHFIAWMWMLGEDGFDDALDNHEYYGKPQLERISEYFKIDWKQLDNGERIN